MARPDYLKQGEPARLFPVLSTTSKEGRATSILLSCMSKIDELSRILLETTEQRIGKRTKVDTYTEVVFSGEKTSEKDRPDGLIICSTGDRQWKALVEAKVGSNQLNSEQIERYRNLAKENGVDCIITISNQFATRPENHPLSDVRKSRSKIPIFHWSWMYILTSTDLLLTNRQISDSDQALVLNELRRFLSHESTGVKGFDKMPPEWTELVKNSVAGARIQTKSREAFTVVDAWHQEMRDLTLILSRQTEAIVEERITRKHISNPSDRIKDALEVLRDEFQLKASILIPDSASSLDIIADLSRRSINVGMTIRAPEDRKSSKARLNWLIRQLKDVDPTDIFIQFNWPGRSQPSHASFSEILEDPGVIDKDKENLQVLSFHIFYAKPLGSRFAQLSNFIVDLEKIVPDFYRTVGQNLSAWRRPPPRITDTRDQPEDVSVEAISQQSEID